MNPLVYLYNLSIEESIFPNNLKLAVKLLFKSRNKSSVNNYRPISMLSNLLRIFEKILTLNWLNLKKKISLLSKDQYGFRPGLSRDDVLCVYKLFSFCLVTYITIARTIF